jgi:signal transduction histidine kinase
VKTDPLGLRRGRRPYWRFVAASGVTACLGGLALDALSLAYIDGSTLELAGGVALSQLGLLLSIGTTTWRWLPEIRAINGWMAGDRDIEPREMWRILIRQPLLPPITGFPAGLVFVALPLAIYSRIVLDVPTGEAAIIFAGIGAGGVYAALLLYFATEAFVRPELTEIARGLPADFRLPRVGTRLAWKLMGALLLITLGTGGLVAVIASAARGDIGQLGLLLGVTVGVTFTATLLIALLLTKSIATPVGYLVEATEQVKEGDLRARAPVISDDEVGVLTGSFNEMTADLQRSRGRLVTAREEERRRLRRDLHDGLGPALAGVAMKLDAAGALVEQDPAAAREQLAQLRAETSEAIDDIRRLVYELRPPQLDELGLVGAIEERAARLAVEDGGARHGGLSVRVEAPPELPPLPAAVEVAVYRIAQEALANVVRHSGAGQCTVRVTLNAGLELEVYDDGGGLPERHRPGVGLGSMRARAAELGGSCTIEHAAGGGTVVRANLPLPADS